MSVSFSWLNHDIAFDGNTRLLFGKQIFLLFLLTYSDLEGTETLGFVPETLFFLVSFIYRTLSVLVILDFPLSLQDR